MAFRFRKVRSSCGFFLLQIVILCCPSTGPSDLPAAVASVDDNQTIRRRRAPAPGAADSASFSRTAERSVRHGVLLLFFRVGAADRNDFCSLDRSRDLAEQAAVPDQAMNAMPKLLTPGKFHLSIGTHVGAIVAIILIPALLFAGWLATVAAAAHREDLEQSAHSKVREVTATI